MAEVEVSSLKTALEKALEGGATESEVQDMLKGLQGQIMTIDILRSTKVGKSVHNASKKFAGSACGKLAEGIVTAWKAVADRAKKEEKAGGKGGGISAKLESNRTPATVPAPSPASAPASFANDGTLPGINDDQYDNLDSVRRKILHVLADRLKPHCVDVAIANFLAYTIEGSVHRMHHSDGDRANYTAKARSLIFNLKQNEALRQDLADGNIPAEALVFFTQAQLATESQREKLKKGEADAVLERRSDYFKIARDKLCRDNNIDPDQGGQFRCRKCGGNKTTNYQMQTRSADEPMTVFICCLKCGHRWRE